MCQQSQIHTKSSVRAFIKKIQKSKKKNKNVLKNKFIVSGVRQSKYIYPAAG